MIARVCVETRDGKTDNFAVPWPEKVSMGKDNGWLIIEGAYRMSASPSLWTIDKEKTTIMVPRDRVRFVEITPLEDQLTDKQIDRLTS